MKLKREPKPMLQRVSEEIKWHYLIQSIGELALGIVLIALPEQRTGILCIAMGILLMVYGLLNVYLFVVNHWNELFGDEMLYGIMLTALGLAFLTRRELMIELTTVVFGILILIDSVIDLRRALLLRKLNIRQWTVLLVIGLITAVFGVLFIVYPNLFKTLLLIFVGVILIFEAVSTWVLLFIFARLRSDLVDRQRDEEAKAAAQAFVEGSNASAEINLR